MLSTSKSAFIRPKGENVVLLSETLYKHEIWTPLCYVDLGHIDTLSSNKLKMASPVVCTSILSAHYICQMLKYEDVEMGWLHCIQ